MNAARAQSASESLKPYLEIFDQVGARVRPLLDVGRIEAHVDCWHEAAVFKLQKRRWANQSPAAGPSEVGIFFSVWVDATGLRQSRAFYNIHALKLRSLECYSIQSREFATVFRLAFAESARDWPHVSTDYGPQTLMQGWIELDSSRMAADVAELVRRFIPLAELIDQLLDQRTKQPAPATARHGRTTTNDISRD
jgi:hypothetical protein